MIVLIDSGNTLAKFGWLDPSTGRRETAALALERLDPASLDTWFARFAQPPVLAIGVNVAGRKRADSLEAQFARRGCAVQWRTSRDRYPGLRSAYDPPEQLGADRWLSLVGMLSDFTADACRDAPGGLMLATFGTATTIDTATPDAVAPDTIAMPASNRTATRDVQPAGAARRPAAWAFRGGLILPGPAMMRSALARGTALLPDADGEVADYPTRTLDAIASGIAAAQAGALVRQWAVGLKRHGQPPRVYVTGGGWPALADEVKRQLAHAQAQAGVAQRPARWLPAPVLDGLAAMARSGVGAAASAGVAQ